MLVKPQEVTQSQVKKELQFGHIRSNLLNNQIEQYHVEPHEIKK